MDAGLFIYFPRDPGHNIYLKVFDLSLIHIQKGKDHFDTFNAHFIFAQFLIYLHLSKKGRCRLI